MTPPASAALPFIKVDVLDGVATIVVNRPDALNVINPVVVHQLQIAIDQAIADPGVRGIVMGGEGKVFVVGADIDFFLRNVEAGDISRIVKFTEAGQQLLNTIDRSSKPVVARVNGLALGAGVEIALACDHVVAAPAANLGFPETGLGIYPSLGGTQRTSRKIGIGLTKWLIFTGKTLSSNDALKIGLIDHIALPDKLDEVCRALASGRLALEPCKPKPSEFVAIERFFEHSRAEDLRTGLAVTGGDPALIRAMRSVAGKAPIALRIAEHLLDEGMRRTLDEGLKLEIDFLNEIFSTKDALLGLSFRVGRQLGQPAFEGR